MNEGRKRPSCIVVFGGGFLVLCVLAVVYGAFFMDDPSEAAPTPASARTDTAREPSPAREETLLDLVLEKGSLSSAIVGTRPLMGDSSNEMSLGASLLAIWSLKNVRGNLIWDDIQQVPATKLGLVKKDPTEELGKRLCGRGEILEIQADRSEYGVGYTGGIFMGRGYDIVRFYAVGSTGELVAGSRATFCGVFTGLQSYDNTGGGTTIAPVLVGMFKLPANLTF